MIFLLSALWFIRTLKATLFWIYLWQLKEYHVGRFLDHFRTEKGQKLIENKVNRVKVLLMGFFSLGLLFTALSSYSYHQLDFWFSLTNSFSSPYSTLEDLFTIGGGLFFLPIIPILFGVYVLESSKAVLDWKRQKLFMPLWTKKTIFLAIACVTVFIVLLTSFYYVSKILSTILFFDWIGRSVILAGGFLMMDILTPFLVCAVVLGFQPFAVFARWKVIKEAKQKQGKFKNLIVIGITGSYGKTSTKEFLAHILSSKFKVLKTKEHQNSEVGISNCILNELNESHEIFVCEMGAYNKGGIKLLASIAKPRIAILTGANEQHLATFGSMENLLSAEGGKELIAALPKDGLAIFNGNNPYVQTLYTNTERKDKVLCSSDSINFTIVKNTLSPDFWADGITVEKEKVSFQVFTKEGEHADFEVFLVGGYNVENLLLATACAKKLGMSLIEIASACKSITPAQGVMKLKKGVHGLHIIDSTYSANPDGVIAALEYLKVWPSKKVIVMPCLIELGKASKEVHKRIGEKIAEVCDLAIITTKDRFEDIKEAASAKASASQRKVEVVCMENTQEIVEKIKSTTRQGDVVLLEGRVPTTLNDLLIQR